MEVFRGALGRRAPQALQGQEVGRPIQVQQGTRALLALPALRDLLRIRVQPALLVSVAKQDLRESLAPLGVQARQGPQVPRVQVQQVPQVRQVPWALPVQLAPQVHQGRQERQVRPGPSGQRVQPGLQVKKEIRASPIM